MEAYDLYREQKSLRLESVNASVRAFNISLTQYENGQISFERLLNSVEKNDPKAKTSYAQIKGNVANQVVALYKSLGGGWQINSGKAFVSPEHVGQMNKRTDWSDQLQQENVALPSLTLRTGAKPPATDKEDK